MSEPHVYILNMKHRKDRKQQFLKAWTAAGLPKDKLHWFNAVVGANLSEGKLATFRTVAKTRKARAGRVGCYCSHVAAIEKAIRLNQFPLLILEDDAVPSITERVDLEELFASAPPDAALLYFGALPVKGRKRVTFCSANSRGWMATDPAVSLYGGHAYGFRSRDAAEEVLAFLKQNRMTFDSALIRYTKAHRPAVAVHCPFQFYQAEGYSDIEGVARPERGL